MHTLGWIFVGLLTVSLFLFIFFTIKEFKIPAGISRALIMPFSSVIVLQLLSNALPEARHILFLSIIALGLISLCEVFMIFEKNKFLRFIAHVFFLLSLGPWIELYLTTFFIYKTPQWCFILAYVIYGLLLLALLIFTGKNKLITYLITAIGFASTAFINFCAIISLYNNPILCNILLTSGTGILLIAVAFYSKQTTKRFKINLKLESILRIILITLAETLITASGLFMIM